MTQRQVPYVEYKYLEPKALGGTRGKKEYRRHVKTLRIVGRQGGHIFKGACPECGWEFFGKRLEKRKNLFNCPECDFTSFAYKGFFTLGKSRTPEIKPPRQDEFEVELWRAKLKYGQLDPREYYGSKEWIEDSAEGDKYEVIEEPQKV
jgi:predicted Zn-ribbon and HTH transcriptional regulator